MLMLPRTQGEPVSEREKDGTEAELEGGGFWDSLSPGPGLICSPRPRCTLAPRFLKMPMPL